MLRIAFVTLTLTTLTIAAGCSSCTPAPAAEGEGEGEGTPAGEGEGTPAGEGEGVAGEGEGIAGEGEGEGEGGEGEGEGVAGEGEGEGEGEGGGVTEHVIVGGGVADGPIVDTVFVHVVDVGSGDAVSGATVSLDLGAGGVVTQTSDANGLVTFTTGVAAAPVDITVSGAGIRNTTWLGVNGENVTIPVLTASSTGPGTGTLHVSIDTSQFQVSVGNYVNVFASFSEADDSLSQPGDALAESQVVRCTTDPFVFGGTCGGPFTMQAAAGTRTILATVVEMRPSSTIGTPDAVVGVAGYAIAENVDVSAASTTNVTLVKVASTNTANVAFPDTSPAGFGTDAAFVNLDLVDAGGVAGTLLPFLINDRTQEIVPALDDAAVTASSAATYEVVGLLAENGAGAVGFSASISHAVGDVNAFTLPDWLFPAKNIVVDGGGLTVSWDAPSVGNVAQATSFTTVELKNGGDRDVNATVWSIVVLDGRTSFTLPSAAPNPLASGTDGVRVSPAVVPGFDATSFDVPTAFATLSLVSTEGVTFTH